MDSYPNCEKILYMVNYPNLWISHCIPTYGGYYHILQSLYPFLHPNVDPLDLQRSQVWPPNLHPAGASQWPELVGRFQLEKGGGINGIT